MQMDSKALSKTTLPSFAGSIWMLIRRSISKSSLSSLDRKSLFLRCWYEPGASAEVRESRLLKSLTKKRASRMNLANATASLVSLNSGLARRKALISHGSRMLLKLMVTTKIMSRKEAYPRLNSEQTSVMMDFQEKILEARFQEPLRALKEAKAGVDLLGRTTKSQYWKLLNPLVTKEYLHLLSKDRWQRHRSDSLTSSNKRWALQMLQEIGATNSNCSRSPFIQILRLDKTREDGRGSDWVPMCTQICHYRCKIKLLTRNHPNMQSGNPIWLLTTISSIQQTKDPNQENQLTSCPNSAILIRENQQGWKTVIKSIQWSRHLIMTWWVLEHLTTENKTSSNVTSKST